MAENTKIQWADHTFNPWRGCSKVSKGCANCYADDQAKLNPRLLGIWGPTGRRVVASDVMWKQPLKWDAYADAHQQWCSAFSESPKDPPRPRVFCGSMCDIFEDWDGPVYSIHGQPIEGMTLQDVRERLFRLIDATPNLDWLLLTKRPENIAKMMPTYAKTSPSENWFFDPEEQKRRGLTHAGPYQSTMTVSGVGVIRDNVWIGTSVEDQETANARVPHLLKVPAKVRFLSMEPLLGPVTVTFVGCPKCGQSKQPYLPNYVICRNCGYEIKYPDELQRIQWVIVGGESGPKARPFHIEWCRSIIEQCRAADVPVFVKQMGFRPIEESPHFRGMMIPVQLLDPKGGDMTEWLEDLRIRELPAQ